jgi:hypothetical protein
MKKNNNKPPFILLGLALSLVSVEAFAEQTKPVEIDKKEVKVIPRPNFGPLIPGESYADKKKREALVVKKRTIQEKEQIDDKAAYEAVKKRANKRWELLIEGRLESAYEYLSPGTRKITPYKVYAKSIRGVGLWREAAVNRAKKCTSTRCELIINIKTSFVHPRLAQPLESQAFISEVWIYSKKQKEWFVLPEKK